jgi:hypothetical protein
MNGIKLFIFLTMNIEKEIQDLDAMTSWSEKIEKTKRIYLSCSFDLINLPRLLIFLAVWIGFLKKVIPF